MQLAESSIEATHKQNDWRCKEGSVGMQFVGNVLISFSQTVSHCQKKQKKH